VVHSKDDEGLRAEHEVNSPKNQAQFSYRLSPNKLSKHLQQVATEFQKLFI